MSGRGPNKEIGFTDYPLAGQVEVPPETPLADGFNYPRDEVQGALGGESGKFVLNIVTVDEGLPDLE